MVIAMQDKLAEVFARLLRGSLRMSRCSSMAAGVHCSAAAVLVYD
jgi:hypothetical protein